MSRLVTFTLFLMLAACRRGVSAEQAVESPRVTLAPSIVGRWEEAGPEPDAGDTPDDDDPRFRPGWIEFYDTGRYRSDFPRTRPSPIDGVWMMDSDVRITLLPDEDRESRFFEDRCDLHLDGETVRIDRWIGYKNTGLGPLRRVSKSPK